MSLLKAMHINSKKPRARHSQKPPWAGAQISQRWLADPEPYQVEGQDASAPWGARLEQPGGGESPRTYVALPELRFQALHVQSIQPSKALEDTVQHLSRGRKKERN